MHSGKAGFLVTWFALLILSIPSFSQSMKMDSASGGAITGPIRTQPILKLRFGLLSWP